MYSIQFLGSNIYFYYIIYFILFILYYLKQINASSLFTFCSFERRKIILFTET